MVIPKTKRKKKRLIAPDEAELLILKRKVYEEKAKGLPKEADIVEEKRKIAPIPSEK